MRETRKRRARRMLVLVCLGVATLLVAGLGYEAVKAARDQRATVESVLRDYAALAAEQFANSTGMALDYGVFFPVLRRMRPPGAERPWHPQPEQELEGQLGKYRADELALAFFSLDLESGTITWSHRVMSTAGDDDANGAITAWAHEAANKGWQVSSRALEDGGKVRVYALYLDGTENNGPSAAWGFEAKPAGLRQILGSALDQAMVLPRSMIEAAGKRQIASVRVLSPDGVLLFENGLRFEPTFAASTQLTERQASLRVQVAIPATAAAILVEGGLPHSRLPLVGAMLLVTVGLVAGGLALLRQERELVRLRENFVAGASHELRTPLAQIRMFSETLRLDRVRSDSERRRSLEVLDREARRLTYLVDNLLQFSSPADAAAVFAPQRTELNGIVADVIEGFAPIAAARQVSIRLDAGGQTHAVVDRDMFRQILLNLLDNAVKYGPPDQRVEVELRARGGWVVLAVTDAGPGVAPHHRAHVWERFWRAPDTGGITGTGIGLTLVRELTEVHGGSVRIADGPEGGARFLVRLPQEGP